MGLAWNTKQTRKLHHIPKIRQLFQQEGVSLLPTSSKCIGRSRFVKKRCNSVLAQIGHPENVNLFSHPSLSSGHALQSTKDIS